MWILYTLTYKHHSFALEELHIAKSSQTHEREREDLKTPARWGREISITSNI